MRILSQRRRFVPSVDGLPFRINLDAGAVPNPMSPIMIGYVPGQGYAPPPPVLNPMLPQSTGTTSGS